MKCPSCSTELKMSERQGIEIDYCPQCRGVWLDKGELDKIIERAALETTAQQRHRNEDDNSKYRKDERYDRRNRNDDDEQNDNRNERGSFFGNLFDF